jgi:hypothetical protein
MYFWYPNQLTMTDIRIINNRYTEILKERDPNEEWDGEETVTSNDIEGFEIVTPEDKYKTVDLPVSFEIDPKRTYYLVSVIYSTGDSFNRHDGEVDYIELYESSAMANATKKMIENSYKAKDKEERYSIEILNNEGVMYQISSSAWTGYFERLEEVRVDGIRLKV